MLWNKQSPPAGNWEKRWTKERSGRRQTDRNPPTQQKTDPHVRDGTVAISKELRNKKTLIFIILLSISYKSQLHKIDIILVFCIFDYDSQP